MLNKESKDWLEKHTGKKICDQCFGDGINYPHATALCNGCGGTGLYKKKHYLEIDDDVLATALRHPELMDIIERTKDAK